jgi:hypothetical protein
MIMITVYTFFKGFNIVKLLACGAGYSGSFVKFNKKVLRKWDRL